MIPTILDDTVTKKNPKTTIIIAESRLVGIDGIIAIKATRTTAPTSTNTSGKSFSVLRVLFPAEPALKSPIESLKALTMVGRVFIRVIIPPKVTAPAPMYLI